MLSTRLIVVLAVPLFFWACAPKDDGPTEGDGGLVEFTLPPSATLNAQQKEQLKELKTPSSPSEIAGVLIVPENEPSEDRMEREDKRRKMPANLAAFVDRTHRTCTTNRSKETVTGSLLKA